MNRKIVSLLCVFSLLPMGAVYAAPIDSVKENVDTGGIIVSGDFGEKDRIAVELIKPGVGTESLNGANNANIMSLIENVLHFKTSDGKYEVEIPVSEDAVAGVYTVAVNGDRLNTVARATIEWKSPEVIKGVFDNFIKTVSQDEVYALISQKDNCDCLGISYSLMNNLSDSEKKDIARELFNNKASIQKVADLRSVYTDKAVILAIPKAVDNDELIKIILEYPDVLNISEKDNFKDFKNKGNTYQKSIASRILRKNISSKEEFEKLFDDASFLAKIEFAQSVADINPIMKDNSDRLSTVGWYFNENTYNYDKEILAKSFNSIADLEYALNELHNKPKDSGNGGGGSSGASKSNDNTFISAPQTTDIAADEVFDDLGDVEWAKTAILALANKNIVSGRGDKKFAPNDLVTREEFVKMAVGAFDISAEGDVPFTDVDKNAWYYSYIAIAYNSGLVKGIEPDVFGTGTNITRQDMAVLIHRFMSEIMTMPNSGIVAFDDKIDISDYAREGIASLREAGIISGMTENMFMPKEKCTRAQIAYIIYKALKYAGRI